MRRVVFLKFILLVVTFVILIFSFNMYIFASGVDTEIVGKVYEFNADNEYDFSKSNEYEESILGSNTYGKCKISGNIIDTYENNGVTAYKIDGDTFDFYYTYSDTLQNVDESEWKLTTDRCKKVDGKQLKNSIENGLLILQTSKDRNTWIDEVVIYNAFQNEPIKTDLLYSAKSIELINGCYYRFIVAYETRIKTEPTKILMLELDVNYDYLRHAEVYEFYASNNEIDNNNVNNKYNVGEKARADRYDGYYGSKLIDKSDPHYGWDLGKFYISGQTEIKRDSADTPVIIKNLGDEVTLWFNLEQNIDKLNGNSALSITSDSNWYDQQFETERMESGRGVLVISYTDFENVKHKPIIYTNFLESSATVGADTKVELFEEGDYEVTLDYQIKNDKLVDQYSHYKICFKFIVRNGNCMVYPFDVKTKSELINSSVTENGFYLDLAKSRYLSINVTKEILVEGADGLTKDTRFNKPARDGEEYCDEGIYTIEVKNQYTGQITAKKIYVGSNNLLKAHIINGISIDDLNKLTAQGATINTDGSIVMPTSYDTEEEYIENEEDIETSEELQSNGKIIVCVIFGCIAISILVTITIVKVKKEKKAKIVQEKNINKTQENACLNEKRNDE